MLKRAWNLIGAVVLTLGFAQQASAEVQIVPPGNDVAGQSQLFWARTWWQWALGVPAPNNPLSDTTGQDAGVNNGGPVFFLAGNLSGGVSARTIRVPDGKPIFFPVINSFFVPINLDGTPNPFPCTSPLTLTCAIQAASFTQAENMAVQIDSISLDNAQIEQFRQTSTSYFSVAVPADNVLGVTGPNECCANLWVQDGFYITLDDLSVGTYVLQFQGEGQSLAGGPISLDVTDTLNVVVPEPSTWAMMAIGFVGLGFAAYRRRRAQRVEQCGVPRNANGVMTLDLGF
jgi:PEP-CTERM motif-containing protein